MDSKILCLTRIVGEVTIEKKIEKFKHLLMPRLLCKEAEIEITSWKARAYRIFTRVLKSNE